MSVMNWNCGRAVATIFRDKVRDGGGLSRLELGCSNRYLQRKGKGNEEAHLAIYKLESPKNAPGSSKGLFIIVIDEMQLSETR